jgi:hypothetical protein
LIVLNDFFPSRSGHLIFKQQNKRHSAANRQNAGKQEYRAPPEFSFGFEEIHNNAGNLRPDEITKTQGNDKD